MNSVWPSVSSWASWSSCRTWATHPVILMLVAAVIMTLMQRVGGWSTKNGIRPVHLRDTIDVIAVVRHNVPTNAFVDLLRTAKTPARVRIRLLKLVAPNEQLMPTPSRYRHAVHIKTRLGDPDEARERLRLAKKAADSAFLLVLAQPVEALPGWDEILVKMLHQCESQHPMLTAQVSQGPTFLRMGKAGVEAAPFATDAKRPQPGLFWTSSMSFARTESVDHLPNPNDVSVDAESLAVSRRLWMAGFDFYAPHAAVFGGLSSEVVLSTLLPPTSAKPADDVPTETAEGADATDAVDAVLVTADGAGEDAGARTAREWSAYVGYRERKRWNRRARLGLTPNASFEETFAKYADALEQHGILAV